MAQSFRSSCQLLLQNLLVFLLLVLGVHVLPGQLAQKEVYQHINHAFDIIPPALFDTQVSIDGGISGSSCEIFIIFVGDVGAIEHVLLGQSEIDDKDGVALLVFANEKVIWLNVTMNESLRVNVFDTIQYLQSDHDDCFQWKTLTILFEQRLEGTTQNFHNHHTFFSFTKVLIHLFTAIVTFRIPLSFDLPSLSKICRILDSQKS